MEITKIELKILIKEFLTASNRVLHANFKIYSEELSKFIKFLDTKPLIKNYIDSCGEPEFNVENEVNEINDNYGHDSFTLGSTDEKEVANIYAVIKYLADKKIVGYSYLYFGYSNTHKPQDNVDGFGEKYIRFLITHIENYLSTLAIRMGVDSKMTVNLEIKDSNLTNAQVSIATDNSTITANQINNDYKHLDTLIEKLLTSSKSLKEEEKEIVRECVETIETIKEDKPKKSIIKMAIKTLKGVVGTTEFLVAVAELAQFVESII